MPLLELRAIQKSFSGVTVLNDLNLTIDHGEVVGLVGVNGAGKSTLAKVISGVTRPDGGALLLDGAALDRHSARTAIQRGIVALYQDIGLINTLSAEENLALFVSVQRGQRLRSAIRMASDALGASEATRGVIGLQVERLSQHQRQLVQAVKANILECRILIADETSATMTRAELSVLFEHIRAIRDRGAGVIFVSHILDEVIEIADRIVVLRDGQLVGQVEVAKSSPAMLLSMMLGADVARRDSGAQRAAETGEVVLQGESLRLGGELRGASVSLRRGEIVGITGLEGSGHHALARVLGGMLRPDSGEVQLEATALRRLTPRRARKLGIAYVTGERRAEGLMMSRSALANVALAHGLKRLRWITSRSDARAATVRSMDRFSIVPRKPDMTMERFSGGNQQKVLMAMALPRDPKVLVLDDPTVGVDAGARQAIHQQLRDIAARGAAVAIASFDLDEVVELCDRVVVLRSGVIVKELGRSEFGAHELLSVAMA